MAERNFAPPAVAVFGEVVSLGKELHWQDQRPLAGRRIVVTRTRKQAGALSDQLRDLGAEVIELPTIRIEPPSDLRAFAELVQDAHAYDWIVFTSPNGVTAFFEMFYKLYDDARDIGGARIAAIGPATAQRVRNFHLKVDLQPDEFVAEAVVREFKKEGDIENLRILIARAEEARDLLPKELSSPGGHCGCCFCLPNRRGNEGSDRSEIAPGQRGRRHDHFYQFIDGRKLSRARVALAGRDEGGKHRPDYVEDRARSWPNDWSRGDTPRYSGFGRCHPPLLQALINMSQAIESETDFAAIMQELSAQAATPPPASAELVPISGISVLISAIHSLGQTGRSVGGIGGAEFRVDSFPENRGSAFGASGRARPLTKNCSIHSMKN